MMLQILKNRVRSLACDEHGVVLMTTLSVFMVMYVACAGIFAVGQTVRERIAMQNAADAAAYSAAVVEADALSRIAALNRVLSWTYKDVVASQMDFTTLLWLKEVHEKYVSDMEKSDAIGSAPYVPDGRVRFSEACGGHVELDVEFGPYSQIEYALKGDELRGRIVEGKERIAAIDEAIATLISEMPSQMKEAAKWTLKANLPPKMADRSHMLFRFGDSDGGALGLFRELHSDDEELLLKFDEPGELDTNDAWFELKDFGGVAGYAGFGREYVNHSLRADWAYRLKTPMSPWIPDSLEADQALSDNDAWDYVKAEPVLSRILTGAFFGEAANANAPGGTVCVGVATKCENPWRSILFPGASDDKAEEVTNGIYAFFSPHETAAETAYAFASSRAAYRTPKQTAASDGYIAHWYNEDASTSAADRWNLCSSDWDAVYLPVRSTCSFAKATSGAKDSGEWEISSTDFLDDWVCSEEASWQPLTAAAGIYQAPKPGVIPQMHSNGKGGRLDWSVIADSMYH